MLQFDTYYHIYNHANGSENLFREKRNYFFFLKKYHQHIDPIAYTIAWCLMPNHFHLLIKIRREEEVDCLKNFSKVSNFRKVDDDYEEETKRKSLFLSKQFSNFFSSYTQSYNKVYKRRGSLFLKNFKRKEVKDETYLRNLIFYIHLNPIHHGFTDNPLDWEHCSYATFLKKQPELLQQLFDTLENYEYLHQVKSFNFDEYENLENELT